MENTKYRTVSNGHWDFLQYLVVKKFLWFKFEEWEYVPKPYYCTFTGRSDSTGSDIYINSLNSNLSKFVTDYPCIDEYLKYYNIEQDKLEVNVTKKQNEYEAKKNTIHYFN